MVRPWYNVYCKLSTIQGHGDSVDQLCWHPTKADMLATASGNTARNSRKWESYLSVENSSNGLIFWKKKTGKKTSIFSAKKRAKNGQN